MCLQLRRRGAPEASAGAGKSRVSRRAFKHGYSTVKGKASHPMEDFHVSEYRNYEGHELGLFAIYDGHLGHNVPDYLQRNLFDNILNEPGFLTDPRNALKNAYHETDQTILSKSPELGSGGSTAVTAILVDGVRLLVANIGDSRAVLSKAGKAIQLSTDHEPSQPSEQQKIRSRGGFVLNMPGDVARVDGQLAVARAFGDKNLKDHLSAEPDITDTRLGPDTEFLILASDGLWKVMSNQEAVDLIKKIKSAKVAAKRLTDQALVLKSMDDISCVVVRLSSSG